MPTRCLVDSVGEITVGQVEVALRRDKLCVPRESLHLVDVHPATATDSAHEGEHVSRVLFAVHEPRTTSPRGANMSVLVRLSASGMTSYMSAPGFVAHAAFVGDGEFHVSEIWESRDDFQNWFDNNVKPNVPGVEIDEVREVHNVIIKE